jgi:hypothetical protein
MCEDCTIRSDIIQIEFETVFGKFGIIIFHGAECLIYHMKTCILPMRLEEFHFRIQA